MKKQKKQMVILLIVCLICVGGFLFLQNVDLEKKDETSEKENYKLEVFDADKVSEIVISGENELHFVKKDGIWNSADDVSFILDQATVNSLVTNLSKIYTDTKIGAVDDPEEFGLKNPVLTIEVKMEDGTEAEIRSGLYNDLAYGYYIQINEDPEIYLADGYVIGSCKKGLNEFQAEVELETEKDPE